MKKTIAFISALLAFAAIAGAKVTLPSILGDGMVLQRNAQVKIWGSADKSSAVTVETSWDGKKYTVKPDKKGEWCVQAATLDAGGPYTISISDGREELTLKDILIGEVWVCSGQSNMEMPLGGWKYQGVNGSLQAIRKASETPLIRTFTVRRDSFDEPQEDCRGEWRSGSDESISKFSATAYFFGRTLAEYLPNVPIGLIATSWGGSPIEVWLSKSALEATPGIDVPRALNKTWNKTIPSGGLFNAMIYPLRKFAARGFIWYQGEANRSNASEYAAMTVSMVNEWRSIWGNPEMPYYLVQIAPYRYNNPDGRSLPLLVQEQYRIPELLPHSGVAPTTDIGHRDCIHPPFKKEVGERLAWLALANDYGVKGLPITPVYKSMKVEGESIRVSFSGISSVGNCLRIHGPKYKLDLVGFEIAGADRVWYDADAKIDSKTNDILVSSPQVPSPVAVRYAFRNWPEGANVVTDYDMPLPPFRTDDWPIEKD